MVVRAHTPARYQRDELEVRIIPVDPIKVAVVRVYEASPAAEILALDALYRAVDELQASLAQRGVSMVRGPLRARFPHETTGVPLHSIWALPIPDSLTWTSSTDPAHPVTTEIWVEDQVAELLHEGTASTRPARVEQLTRWIDEHGYRIIGLREEIYLGTGPTGGRTLIRFPVARQRAV